MIRSLSLAMTHTVIEGGTPTPEKADISLIQAGIDTGIRNTDRKCTRYGPQKLLDELDEGIFDSIHLDQVFPSHFDHEKNQQQVYERIDEHLAYGTVLFTLGGDHSTSYPVLKRLKQQHEQLRVCWLDAHLDLKEPRLTTGTPHDAVVRRLCDQDGFDLDDFWFIGHRATDPDEEMFLEEIHKTAVSEIEQITTGLQRNDLPAEIPWHRGDPVYLSLDVDLLDRQAVPGTTFPVPDGPSCDTTAALIDGLFTAFGPQIIGADLVEVALPLDTEEQTKKNAEILLETLIKAMKSQTIGTEH